MTRSDRESPFWHPLEPRTNPPGSVDCPNCGAKIRERYADPEADRLAAEAAARRGTRFITAEDSIEWFTGASRIELRSGKLQAVGVTTREEHMKLLLETPCCHSLIDVIYNGPSNSPAMQLGRPVWRERWIEKIT